MQHVTIFVAAPSDMEEEKGRVFSVAERLNRGLAAKLNVRLEVKDWRQAIPESGRTQDVILDQMPVSEWDLFVGLLWLRFGTPTGAIDSSTNQEFSSGTQEEFELAYRSWAETKRPRIMFYRCCRGPDRVDSMDPKQLDQVNDFFSRFSAAAEEVPSSLKKSWRNRSEFSKSCLKKRPVASRNALVEGTLSPHQGVFSENV